MTIHAPWLLDWYLTADHVPAALERRVRRHLARCHGCRSHYDQGVRILRATRRGGWAVGEAERLHRQHAAMERAGGIRRTVGLGLLVALAVALLAWRLRG